jgi:hypothetical protein
VKAVVAAALAVAASACTPYLTAQSVAPPGRIGWLDTKHHVLELSAGVAIAFACEKNGPCRAATAISDDPATATVWPAHLARLATRFDAGWTGATSMVPATSFIVVGQRAGRTTIHVRSRDGNRDLTVSVLPEPTPLPPVAAAPAPAAPPR